MPFTPRALTFFRGLARHNEKAWFEAHRDEYESEVRQPMRELIEDLDTRFAQFAPEIGGCGSAANTTATWPVARSISGRGSMRAKA